MTDEEIITEQKDMIQRLISLQSDLVTLIVKSEERNHFLEDLVTNSVSGLDKAHDMIKMLIEVAGQSSTELEKTSERYEKLLEKAREDKTSTIQRYETRLNKVESDHDIVQKQNTDLVKDLSSKGRQIKKLEDILLVQLKSEGKESAQGTQIAIGDIHHKEL